MIEKFEPPDNPRKEYLSQLVGWDEACKVWLVAIEGYLGCSIEEAKKLIGEARGEWIPRDESVAGKPFPTIKLGIPINVLELLDD